VHSDAADLWRALGCPYDAASVAGWSEDLELAHAGHDALVEMGALGAARVVAKRLRAEGARGLTRGPRRATRQNPGGLTTREVDVLRLLSGGFRNAEIAERLHLSKRTVDHHVSSILRKLDVRTRGEAVAAATRLEVLEDR
jgi:DNA-binding NarL/FixJ family response regulator